MNHNAERLSASSTMSIYQSDLLGHASSDESGSDGGYDSEAAELSRTSRATAQERRRKRPKLSHSDSEGVSEHKEAIEDELRRRVDEEQVVSKSGSAQQFSPHPPLAAHCPTPGSDSPRVRSKESKNKKRKGKESRPGVVYLSSVPPHLRPSALRNLLQQRGFSPITRLFLTPISKDAGKSISSASKARRSYTEGWLEFESHKIAKLCAQTLNATPVGGKKGGYYRDDLWNMKYLRGMVWGELMEGVRGEQREGEARRDDERRQIQREAKIYLEGVEEGKKVDGIREKRKQKGKADSDQKPKRTFRQFEAQKNNPRQVDAISDEAQQVLGKIF